MSTNNARRLDIVSSDSAVPRQSNYALQTGSFIDPVSPTILHDLTPGQKVSVLRTPLQTFNNPVVDDLLRDIFLAFYLPIQTYKEFAPEGREETAAVMDWVLSDPTFDVQSMMFVNHKLGSASAAFSIVEQLMQTPNINQALDGLGKAENMENKADDLDRQAGDIENPHGNDADPSDEEDPNQDPPNNDGEGQGDDGSGSEGDGNGSDEDSDAPYGSFPDDFDDNDEDGDGEQDQGGQSGSGKQKNQPKPGEFQPNPEQLRKQAQALRNQASNKREQAKAKMQEGLNSKMNQFARAGAIGVGADFGSEVMAFMSAWGIEEGTGLMLSPEQIMQIMKSFSSSNIAKLTSFIGRVYSIADKTLRGRFPASVAVEAGGYTKEIPSMHPSEVARLTTLNPARHQAIEEWVRQGLGGVTKSMQAANEGAFLVAVDESGSMNGPTADGASRAEVAKALALGLCKAAKSNGQEFLAAGFATTGQFTEFVTPRSDFVEMLRWATTMFGGGTDFDYALKMLMDAFDLYEDEDKFKADLVMITDGEAGISEETKERFEYLRETYGVRLFVLLIGAQSGGLDDLADKTLRFTNLNDAARVLAEFVWD